MSGKPVKQRLVLNFPGFETTTAEHQIGRLTNGGQKTGDLWGFSLEQGELDIDQQSHKTTTSFTARSENWLTHTRFVQFSWDDIISEYENASYPASLLTSLPKYLSFFLDGSVFKYAKASIRYFGFTIYPLVLILVFAIFSALAGNFIASFLSQDPLFSWIFAILLFLIIFRIPGDRVFVNLSINDWAFARDMCNGTNLQIERRYEIFANGILEEIEASKYDEIIIVGHSFGAVWAVAALARVLEENPTIMNGNKITFLALGSSLLKIALVNKAARFIDFTKKLTSQPNLFWHEVQTRLDCISFYKSTPFDPLRIKDIECGYAHHRIDFRLALSEKRYKKMLTSFYRIHRQYILYADKRTHFDFQLKCFGPFLAHDLAMDKYLPETSGLLSSPLKKTEML